MHGVPGVHGVPALHPVEVVIDGGTEQLLKKECMVALNVKIVQTHPPLDIVT